MKVLILKASLTDDNEIKFQHKWLHMELPMECKVLANCDHEGKIYAYIFVWDG